MLRGNASAAARLLGFAEDRFRQLAMPRDFWVEVDPEWFSRPLRVHFDDLALADLMAEGAAWSDDRAIREALIV